MATAADRPEPGVRPARTRSRRRQPAPRHVPAWKTSELLVFLILAVGIFIAAEHVGSSADNAYTAQRAWLYVTISARPTSSARGVASQARGRGRRTTRARPTEYARLVLRCLEPSGELSGR
jgi:hypothetical protein